MGPFTLIDKSAFQALNQDETLTFERYFSHSLPPILLYEIIADLRRSTEPDSRNRSMVRALASKFVGSGPPISEDFRKLAALELTGSKFPMDGRIIPQGATTFPSSHGTGMFVDLTPYNRAILRWADGDFNREDQELAEGWRSMLKDLNTKVLEDLITSHKVIVPSSGTIEEAEEHTQTLLYSLGLQEPLLTWFLARLRLDDSIGRAIVQRFRASNQFLSNFAPYVAHCIQSLLFLLVLERNRLIPQRPTNIIDVQYFFYSPFCYMFVSNDTIHKRMAPLLLRDDQDFVTGLALKESLHDHHDIWKSMPDDNKRRLGFALGSHPYPLRGSLVCQLWSKHMAKWGPRFANRAFKLNDEDKKRALEEATELFDVAGVDTE